jgi:hypothetical protein
MVPSQMELEPLLPSLLATTKLHSQTQPAMSTLSIHSHTLSQLPVQTMLTLSLSLLPKQSLLPLIALLPLQFKMEPGSMHTLSLNHSKLARPSAQYFLLPQHAKLLPQPMLSLLQLLTSPLILLLQYSLLMVSMIQMIKLEISSTVTPLLLL